MMNNVQASFAAEMGKKAAMAVNFNDLKLAQEINDQFEAELNLNQEVKDEMTDKFITTYYMHANKINWF